MRLLIWVILIAWGCICGVAHADIDNLDIGGDLMLEYFFGKDFDLSNTHQDETDFFRTEFHLWFQADLDDNIMARISLEGDRALNSINNGNINNLGSGNGDLELFIEEAYLKAADIAGSGISLSAGRQFLNYGDTPDSGDYNQWWGPGFIIADARSDDPLLLTQLGDYEIDPFDAIVLSHQTENTKIDFLHARDAEDDLLGPSGTSNDDASLSAVYASYFGIENHQIDVYASYNDQGGSVGSLGFDGEKWIVGGRSAGDITEEVAYKAEVAYQFENNNTLKKNEADALGAQAGINYHPAAELKPNLGLLYTFLQHEGPRDLMSGFASPFEGKTYGMIFEGMAKLMNGGINPFTDMHVFNLYGGFEPMKDIALSLDFYYFLLDDKLTRLAGVTDDDLGMEIDSQIDYQFNENLRTFFGGGVYFPGDATEEIFRNDDSAYYVRAGVKVSF